MGIIDTIVAFIALYLVFQIGRWFILPHMKVGVFSFSKGIDGVVIRSIYGVLLYIANAIFHWILAVLFCIYVVWIIIKKFVPEMIIFIPIRMMLLALPPFRPLEDAGILPLIDDIVNILTSGGTIMDKLRAVFNALYNFLQRASGYVASIFNIFKFNVPEVKKTPEEPLEQTAPVNNPEPIEESSSSQMSPTETLTIQNAYNTCIENNTLQIPDTLSAMEIAANILHNSQVPTQCQFQSFDASQKLLSLKYK